MSTTQHTPGPWTWEDLVKAKDGSLAQAKACLCPGILTIREFCEVSPANARLIAAAPELLEALRAVEARLSACCYQGELDKHPLYQLWRQVQQAITKATGKAFNE